MKLRPTDPRSPFYPDVLGAIVLRQPRLSFGTIEFAAGIAPRMVYLNQPFELVCILQNLVDKSAQIRIAIQPPTRNQSGQSVRVKAVTSQVKFKLDAGEVGLLRVPLLAAPDSATGSDLALKLKVQYRTSGRQLIRPPGGGPPPSILSVSPFKLHALQDVAYTAATERNDTEMTLPFSLVAKALPGRRAPMEMQYETLWNKSDLADELRLMEEHRDNGLRFANPGAGGHLYLTFMDAAEERFAARGLPLHPGELSAIAKMLTYTIEDAQQKEPDINIEDTRWFRSLCQILARNPEVTLAERDDIIAHQIFNDVVYEAILLAFRIIQPQISEKLGDNNERANYANRMMKWLAGYGEPDLTFIYLPLAMGGLTVNHIVRSGTGESPWKLIKSLSEAYKGRIRLASGNRTIVFDMLEKMLAKHGQNLIDQGMRPPPTGRLNL